MNPRNLHEVILNTHFSEFIFNWCLRSLFNMTPRCFKWMLIWCELSAISSTIELHHNSKHFLEDHRQVTLAIDRRVVVKFQTRNLLSIIELQLGRINLGLAVLEVESIKHKSLHPFVHLGWDLSAYKCPQFWINFTEIRNWTIVHNEFIDGEEFIIHLSYREMPDSPSNAFVLGDHYTTKAFNSLISRGCLKQEAHITSYASLSSKSSYRGEGQSEPRKYSACPWLR